MGQDNMLFTAGQFAKMHSINKRTLHYYDEIGLFSPSYKGENGYRYYTYLQSPMLEMLLTLRELEMSTADIIEYMKHRSPAAFEEIIDAKINEVEGHIRRLKDIHKLLKKKKEQINLCRQIDFTQIEIVSCPKEYLLLSRSITGNYDAEDFSILTSHMQEFSDHRIFNKSYGCMIGIDSILAGQFEDYTCFYTQVEKPSNKIHRESGTHVMKKNDLFMKPAGRYVRAFCLGEWENLADCYRSIVKYAKAEGLVLQGYAYETGQNEMTIQSMDQYITQIMILCE